MIQTYTKGKDVSVMVWAAFSGHTGLSDLYIMDRDVEAKKMGYSANSYLEVLDENLLTMWEPSLIFMQDNALIHCAKKVKQWFIDHAIPVLEWPPYSPDLNPIEHLWWHMKRLVYEVNLEINNIRGPEAIRIALEEALPRAWELLNRGIINTILDLIPRRL